MSRSGEGSLVRWGFVFMCTSCYLRQILQAGGKVDVRVLGRSLRQTREGPWDTHKERTWDVRIRIQPVERNPLLLHCGCLLYLMSQSCGFIIELEVIIFCLLSSSNSNHTLEEKSECHVWFQLSILQKVSFCLKSWGAYIGILQSHTHTQHQAAINKLCPSLSNSYFLMTCVVYRKLIAIALRCCCTCGGLDWGEIRHWNHGDHR